ncbi:MAG: B3/4 domain-containing protein [Alphaproteobacteria bacterium]
MKNILISDDFSKLGLNVSLGCIEADVACGKDDIQITKLIQAEAARISSKYSTDSIKDIPTINATRKAYKAIGKDPSRYRSSAEALHKRIVQGKDLYRINNLVDAGNLISMHTGLSLGAYDNSQINGDVIFRIGIKDETYKGIGRDYFNLEGLSVFADSMGAFGNPTGDSERTMITDATNRLLMILIAYDIDDNSLNEAMTFAKKVLTSTCSAQNIEQLIVKK